MSDLAGKPVTLAQRLRPGYCARWHAHPEMAGTECVDAHAARVAKILLFFWPKAGRKLLAAALTHDDGEMGLGDVAGPAKRRHADLAEAMDRLEADNRRALGIADFDLTPFEACCLDLSDKLAGLMHVWQVRRELLDDPSWRADLDNLRGRIARARETYPDGAVGFQCMERSVAAAFGLPWKRVHMPGVVTLEVKDQVRVTGDFDAVDAALLRVAYAEPKLDVTPASIREKVARNVG